MDANGSQESVSLPGKPATTLVICPAEPRAALLQATCLAGVLHAELRICESDGSEVGEQTSADRFEKVYAVGKAAGECRRLWPAKVASFADAQAVAAAYVAQPATIGRDPDSGGG